MNSMLEHGLILVMDGQHSAAILGGEESKNGRD